MYMFHKCKLTKLHFSSPELKAKNSFSGRLLTVVWLSVNFSHLYPLLQNNFASFNQIKYETQNIFG